jgi:hypothetical protein
VMAMFLVDWPTVHQLTTLQYWLGRAHERLGAIPIGQTKLRDLPEGSRPFRIPLVSDVRKRPSRCHPRRSIAQQFRFSECIHLRHERQESACPIENLPVRLLKSACKSPPIRPIIWPPPKIRAQVRRSGSARATL